ncbi:hypothetical protein HYH03_000419 [Edaphochlamys debaryana]|uniref:Polymerase nucleotidyl transferase domain-containing protein n=1 Tax=Edaphochlamys debaryana TaxID=47281 RepID=A0A835YJ62_9CHLO|nr:hypothetical protein HYH03_000419 [Edaphochlamys debaryana]|eukprot:KAG2501921.1 hypothetical protein HYH03_000419 [Edaphochlamys debaryana]
MLAAGLSTHGLSRPAAPAPGLTRGAPGRPGCAQALRPTLAAPRLVPRRAQATPSPSARPRLLAPVPALSAGVAGAALTDLNSRAWLDWMRDHGQAFADECVWPLSASKAEMKRAGRVVDRLARIVQQLPGLGVSRVHKGGSYGRGTMVTRNFDVDLIVYVHTLNGKRMSYPGDWRDGDIPRELRLQVRCGLIMMDLQVGDARDKYAMPLMVEDLDVDLLLLPDVLEGATPPDPDMDQHQLFMRNLHRFGPPSVTEHYVLRERADSPAFTAFVRGHPGEVKAVVRALKAWRNKLEWERYPNLNVKSAPLEVLVLAAHQLLQAPGSLQLRGGPYMLQLFLASLLVLIQAVQEGAAVTVKAGQWGPPYDPLHYAKCWATDPVKIILPSDPTCNLARRLSHKPTPQWAALAHEADGLLRRVAKGGYQALRQELL